MILAYKASSYLQEFLKRGAIVPQPNSGLDEIYHEFAPMPEALGSSSGPLPSENTNRDQSTPSSQDPPSLTSENSNSHREPRENRVDGITQNSNSRRQEDSESAEPSTSHSSKEHDDHPSEARRRLILTREAVPAIMQLFESKPNSTFAGDVYRALEQARLRLRASKSQ
ncbi:hypothetical protein NLI96_g1439 [Meripilus lineatus]|uniref:Uncharacterized protein n=1 Tax=Meripilus lineatus TaxID=2056292 RepID=A0AAD5YIE6_9APHY|nr:hypothetical protein NLI96_g1439 [Physisporinus lineatus]